MNGLYALKPWYAARLAHPRALLVRHGVAPSAISVAGVAFAGAAALSLALLPTGPIAASAVGTAVALRLACANLDGGVARAAGRCTPWGSVVNELSDRIADAVAIAGLLAHADAGLVATALFAATLPSWISLAGAAAGARRIQGGPVGKTERCALLVATAALGHAGIAAAVIAAGSVVTAGLRLRTARRELAGAR